MEQVSKESVNYRSATGNHRCGNCVMFHNGKCDLVEGQISPEDTCDRWEAKVEKSAAEIATDLSAMRSKYFSTLDRIELYQRAGAGDQVRKEAETLAWTIRRNAFPLLVKLYDEGHDTRAAAAGFGWSQDQLQNAHLREWLCG